MIIYRLSLNKDPVDFEGIVGHGDDDGEIGIVEDSHLGSFFGVLHFDCIAEWGVTVTDLLPKHAIIDKLSFRCKVI